MIYKLGTCWEADPGPWRNMVSYLRSQHGIALNGSWEGSYNLIDEYLYENFRGRLDSLDHNVSCIDFEREEQYTWFIMRWS